MAETDLITDIKEAVSVIETYKLSGLVWAFEDCPLSEITHYVDKYLSFRLIFDPGNRHIDFQDYRITLNFHPDYHIHIILSTEDEGD